jgi:hypothetical protein
MIFLGIPTYLLAIIVCGTSVALSLWGATFVQGSISGERRRKNNEVAGFIYAVVGVVYAVIMAFVVVVVWEQFSDARTDAEHEANAIGDLSHLAVTFPDSSCQRIRQACIAYGETVIAHEWPAMAQGKESDETFKGMAALGKIYANLSPSGPAQEAAYAESIRILTSLHDARRARLSASGSSIPSVMWVLLIGGGILTVGFSYFFGMEENTVHRAMSAMLAAMIAFVLFLILVLDYPFTGDISVSPEALERVMHHIRELQGTIPGSAPLP